ncbi:MAG: hypothetical protein GY749_34260 [Desulfobacteraceae bacterium]|nr:hypothetical protein [Desulfobacteraceae bacterium]
MQVAAMEEVPEFEFSEAELKKLAEELVTDSDRNEMNLSICIDPDIAAFVHKLAEKKNTEAERIVNDSGSGKIWVVLHK